MLSFAGELRKSNPRTEQEKQLDLMGPFAGSYPVLLNTRAHFIKAVLT